MTPLQRCSASLSVAMLFFLIMAIGMSITDDLGCFIVFFIIAMIGAITASLAILDK